LIGFLVFLGTACNLARGDVSPASPVPAENFGQYLMSHQAELGPFFSENGTDFFARAVPFFLELAAEILFLSYLIGWGVDVLLGRGFAVLFAPTLNNFQRAFVYASGRVVIGILSAFAFSVVVVFGANSPNFQTYLGVAILLLIIVGGGIQVGWIHYLYRPDPKIGVLFYLTLIVVHGFITLAISSPLVGAPAGRSVQAFVDQAVTPKLENATAKTRADLISLAPAHQAAANAAAEMNDRIDQSKDEQAEVQKQIAQARNSQAYLFSQIVKIHARGDLTAARDQLASFLARFPHGPVAGLARGQLVQVTSEMNSQQAEQRQAQAAKASAAAQDRANLLARASKGQVTLSEMRRVLLGKSPDEVSALLGSPTEIASDRWGFSRQMILNPLTEEKSGLAVYFNEGAVQSVDYYYGNGGGAQ
jgi:hypothetical protein